MTPRRRQRKWIASAVWIVVGSGLIGFAGVLASRPDDVESATRRASERLGGGDGYGALLDFDRALAQLPPDDSSKRQRRAELLLRRGDLHLLLGRALHALSDFREAQQLTPGDWTAWERVGRARIEQEEFDAAAQQFEEAATAFPDRARWFRHAAGAAHWRTSRRALEAAELDLEARVRPGQRTALVRALERHVASSLHAPDRARIERELLAPAASGGPSDGAFAQLADARRAFDRAEAALADYDLCDGLELAYGVVRAEMHLQAGRTYELRRLAELLLRLPGARDSDEGARLQAALANGLAEIGLVHESVKALESLRLTQWRRSQAAESRAERVEFSNESFRAFSAMVRARLERRQGKEADLLLADLPPPAPDHLQNSFFRGYCDFLLGRHDSAEPLLERCATLLIAGNGRHWQLRTIDDRLFVMQGVIEGLAAAGRVELATSVIDLALDIAPDPAPLLEKRITLLRPLRERQSQVVADAFELLQHGRGDGTRLRRFEEEWKRARPAAPPLQAVVAEQVERVRRVYRSGDAVVSPALRELALMALGDRKHKTLPADALTGASTALLGDLAREPGLALQVWRALIHSGDRDQAYLLLHGLAADHPRILDFRFLLARHEIGDGRLADAAKSLDALVAESPGDSDLLLAALNVALERGDLAAAHALAMSSFDGGDSPLARRVAATLALERGRLAEAAVATGDGADLSTAEARALAGLAARVAAERGDPDAAARAEAVLAADPAEPSAWIARVVACARPGGAAATAALDRLVAEKLDATDPLDELELVTLAERCRDVGAAAAAESLALRALVRAPRHAAAELVLADSLLLQSRWDDALRLLTAPTPTAATPHGLMRATLALGARDGALPAWEWLRDRTRLGESERAMARWLALLAAATGRVLPAIDVLERHSVALAADDVQFLAMAMSVHSTTLPAGMQRGPIAEQIRQQRAGDNGGDREFERWVSLALGGSEQSFAEELCELLLLRDLPELGAHAEARAQRIETRFGPLGTLSRERAERRRAAGDVAGATSLLAAELVADPQDVVTLEALLPWLEAISDEAFAALPGAPARRRLTPARSALIEAEEARRASDPVRAEAAWQFAVDDPATRPLAQLALLRSAFTSGRGRTGLATAPWCLHADLAASTRAAGDSGDAAARSAAIVAVAHDPATDAATRRRLATIIDELSAPLAADVRRSLATALTARPGPWYGAFALLAGDLVTRAPDAAALQRIDDGLAAALAADGDGAPEAAIDAIVALVRASRRAGDSTRTDRWRDELAQRSAAHPLLLTELGFAALSAGDFTTADDRFELALALGGRDPEALSWLASRRLAVDGDPRAAVALATEAIKAAPARDQALLRASAGETSARASFVLGAFDASMASWSSAARERGDDPQSHVDCALEAFTRGLPAARDRLRKAADRDGPHQPLARRLLAVLEAAPKS